MSLTSDLYALDQLDSEIEQQEGAIRDIRRRITRNPELEATEARLETVRKQEAESSGRQRSLENDIADLDARIKRDHGRLYSGQVVDSREIASLERELEHYRSRKDELEEQCLTVMDRTEHLQSELATLTQKAESLRAQWEADKVTLAREGRQKLAELNNAREKREAAAGTIEPRALDIYTRLRKTAGHAVSLVSGGVCGQCRVTIPAKDIQHARTGDVLVHCPHCNRILCA
jgi:predicted  nucleic acid-binding Zn-ribbon protein